MTNDKSFTLNNKTYESTIKFVWDKTYIEFITGKKFNSEREFTDYVSDKSVDLINESIKDKSIYWLFNINQII